VCLEVDRGDARTLCHKDLIDGGTRSPSGGLCVVSGASGAADGFRGIVDPVGLDVTRQRDRSEAGDAGYGRRHVRFRGIAAFMTSDLL
jgi:hypothetical protein